MNGYCAMIKQGPDFGYIYHVFLVNAEEKVVPIDLIEQHCDRNGLTWDDQVDKIEWFAVSDVEKLRAIKWPDQGSDSDRALQQQDKVQVYRAFELKQVTLVQALDALGNEAITKAIGLGWKPHSLKRTLKDLAYAMEDHEQAEAYREGIMSMVDDIELAVSATEVFYKYPAAEFLVRKLGYDWASI